MNPNEKLKEIKTILLSIPESGISYRKDMEWLINRVEKLTKALEIINESAVLFDYTFKKC